MFGWLTGKTAESTQQADVAARIEQRFPSHVLYRVPQAARDFYAKGTSAAMPASFLEDGLEWWVALLNAFPNPPSTEDDRKEREKYFWNTYVDHLSTKDVKGTRSLLPKQDIFDFFQTHEKAIFRQYYAATGLVKKTIAEELSNSWIRLKELFDDRDRNTKRFDAERQKANETYERQIIREYRSESHADSTVRIERAHDKIEQYLKSTMPEHFRKEGEWFFSRVEDAFNHSVAKDDEPIQNVHGEGGFATRDDIPALRRRAALIRPSRTIRPAAQDQEFDT